MKRVCAVLALCACLCGCRHTTALRDELVVTALALHQQDGVYVVSVQAVDVLRVAGSLTEQNDRATTVYTARGASISAALETLLEQAGKRAFLPHTRLLVVSEALCRTASLHDILNFLTTDDDVHAQTPIVVFNGDPVSLLSNAAGDEAIPSAYLVDLLKEGATRGVCIERTVLDTERALSGMFDAVLPMVTIENDTPVPDGTVLFRNGTFAGTLTAAETAGLSVLSNDLSTLLVTENGVTYRIDSLHTTPTVSFDDARLTVCVSITGEAHVVERQGEGTCDSSAVTAHVEACVKDALDSADRLLCDPLGLARRVALRYPTITQKTARSQLNGCDKAVSVTIRLR